jgi:hypothetical protein
MPTLDYAVTRNFPGRVFAPAAILGAIIVLAFLATINGSVYPLSDTYPNSQNKHL